MTTKRRIAKPALLAVTLALTLLALRSAPAMSAEVPPLSVEEKCGPTTFRPNEWVVYECLVRLTNDGNTPLSNVTSGYKSSSGVIPQYFFVLYELNGKPMPIDPTTTSYGGGYTLQPGQTANVRLDVLVEMPSEGVYDGEWPALVDGVEVPTAPLHFEGKADAPEPPTGLEITLTRVMSSNRKLDPNSTDTQTVIVNRTSQPVTELTITEHWGGDGTLRTADPAASAISLDANLAEWDLASFGKQSLAPGETLVVQKTYEPITEGGCGSVQTGVMVEATIDGEVQRFGAGAGNTSIGCASEDVTPPDSGDDIASHLSPTGRPPSTGSIEAVRAPSAGEGSPSESTSTVMYAALTAIGVAFVGAAQLVRRRTPR